MILHADGISGVLTLISIPRDLYYRGRKINALYRLYGPAYLAKSLSDITGLEITTYAVVDMFAFIDVINILGGVDIYLDEDLIDPTYRIKDDGVWGTLYYKKGQHHLNGIEALRVARSRHYSSDFGRAERQQQLIWSIKDKFLSLGFADIGRFYELIQVMFQYVDTNLTPFEALSLFKAYGNLQDQRNHVLNTDNVLYDTYTNVFFLEDKSIADEEGYDKGAWILLPEQNNWNLIPWYIRSILTSPEAE